MTWKQFAKDYLSFSRKERIAVLTLTGLIVVVILIPSFLSDKALSSSTANADTAWISAAKRLEIKDEQDKNQKSFAYRNNEDGNNYQYDRPTGGSFASASLFNFDPNTLDESGWKKLGIKEKTIRTIQNYLNKGGHFYKAGDLKKVYGIYENDYLRLEPYINIESIGKNERRIEYVKKETEPKNPDRPSIDINTADEASFVSLPGIGEKLAARIINFRDKLGGFYSINQIGEIYGLPDSTFQKLKDHIKLENTSVKKININSATVDELKNHPYIKYSIANPIISYRNEHGVFSKIEDVKKVMAVTDQIYDKIAPYLIAQ